MKKGDILNQESTRKKYKVVGFWDWDVVLAPESDEETHVLVYGAAELEGLISAGHFIPDEKRAVFVRKPSNLMDLKRPLGKGDRGVPIAIEKTIVLSTSEYMSFCSNLISDREFIVENIEKMFVDKHGIWHCILVKEEGSAEVILIQSEGYDFPKYAAHYKE